MNDFVLFCTAVIVIVNLVLIIFRNFEWSTTKFKTIGYCSITVLITILYFVEEFTVYHPDFYKFIVFALSPVVVLLIDLIFKKICIIEYNRDFDFIIENDNDAYFGETHDYNLLDKAFSIILLMFGAGLPILIAIHFFQS